MTITYIAPVDIGTGDTPLQMGIVGDGTPIVVHDPLCPCQGHQHHGPTDYLRTTCVYCKCQLIDLVRSDERTRVVDGRPL